ncbi:MAG: hypothetical protein AAF383_05995 [Cyanobacteria bacterium P01_A01_bin.83]
MKQVEKALTPMIVAIALLNNDTLSDQGIELFQAQGATRGDTPGNDLLNTMIEKGKEVIIANPGSEEERYLAA